MRRARFGRRACRRNGSSLRGRRCEAGRRFPGAFGYNAIRVPLYLALAGYQDRKAYEPFAKLWSASDPAGLPILDVASDQSVGRLQEPGYAAVAALVACAASGTALPPGFAEPAVSENYYPATLHLLALAAANTRYRVMSRALRRRGAALSLLAGLSLDLAGAATEAQAQSAPDAAGSVLRDERRAPVILGASGAPSSASEIVDESGLRYYAAQRQTDRVQTEIARLRRRYPNWTVPTDLDTLKPSPPEEAPLWDLFTAGRVEEVRAAIAARQAVDPDWHPSEDLARKLNRGTLRGEVKAAEAKGDWDRIRARVDAAPETLRNLDIDIAWTVAEAYARTGDLAQAANAYRNILSGQSDTALRLATVQKAMANLPMAKVEPLLATGHSAADGSNEFNAIRLDVTRARIAAVLHEEPAGQIEPADLAALGEAVRKGADPAELSLLGWYAYHRRQFREALDWFKAAIARGGDARIATGLALSLRELGQEREAGGSGLRLAGPLGDQRRPLPRHDGAPADPERRSRRRSLRLDRFAKLVLHDDVGRWGPGPGLVRLQRLPVRGRRGLVPARERLEAAGSRRPGLRPDPGPLKRVRDFMEIINRYDGLFPTVVDLALPPPESQAAGPCDPVRDPAAARRRPPSRPAFPNRRRRRRPRGSCPCGGASFLWPSRPRIRCASPNRPSAAAMPTSCASRGRRSLWSPVAFPVSPPCRTNATASPCFRLGTASTARRRRPGCRCRPPARWPMPTPESRVGRPVPRRRGT